MFERAFAHHDLDWRYLTFEVSPENLGNAVRGLQVLGFRGGHCADAHKQAIISWLDHTTQTATLVGAVNVVFREENALVGDNTEGKGLVRAIGRVVDLAGKQIVLLGAGRVARAAAIELAAAGVGAITVVNRTIDRASELVGLLDENFNTTVVANAWQGDYVVPPETDVLVHATSLGRTASEERLPLVYDSLRPGLLVADVTAESTDVGLLGEAGRRGCKTVDGLSMFIEQVAIGFQSWTGVDPDRRVLREAVEEYLEL